MVSSHAAASGTPARILTSRVSSDQSLLENGADRTGESFFVLRHVSASRHRRRAPPVHVRQMFRLEGGRRQVPETRMRSHLGCNAVARLRY